jgi:hypothetical protein
MAEPKLGVPGLPKVGRKLCSKDRQSWILDEPNAMEISQVHQVEAERMTGEEEGDPSPRTSFE